MRLIDVDRECDRLDDMYTLGDIGRRERDDLTTYMLEVAMPVEAISVSMVESRIKELNARLADTCEDDVDVIWDLRAKCEALRDLLDIWEERNEE